jgi:hypothetical protein
LSRLPDPAQDSTMATTSGIDAATATWLGDPEYPTVRRLAAGRLGIDGGGAVAPTAGEPWIRSLLEEPLEQADGRPVHPYHKWRGVHWRLLMLSELDADPAEPAMRRVVDDGFERVADWVSGPSRLRASRRIDGRVRQCASMDGNAALAAIRLGLAADPRVAVIVRRLAEWQWPDGGWNCDKHPEAAHSSFNESLAPLRALAAYSRVAADPDVVPLAESAADRAARFFLEHRVDRSHRTGELAHPSIERLAWPAYWHYDRLQGLRALREAGHADDPRTTGARESLRAAADVAGRWSPDRRHWKGPGSPGSNVECVAWTREGERRMLTLLALEELRAS